MELLYGLIYCVNRENNRDYIWITKNNNEYIEGFYEIYLKYANKELKEYLLDNKCGLYHVPGIISLTFDENFKLKEKANDLKEIIDIDLKYFSKIINKYIQESNIYNYFNDNEDFYKKIINDIKEKLPEDFNLNYLNDTFNSLCDKYNIILSNFISGGFGINIENENYCLLGIRLNKTKERYTITGNLIPKLFHEFSHPYVGIITKKYYEKIKADNIHKISIEKGVIEAYHDKKTIIEEYVVRAVEIYLSSKYLGNEYKKWALETAKENGFYYLENFVDRFNKLHKYNSFEEFYKKEIINIFNNI